MTGNPDIINIKARINKDGSLDIVESSLELKLKERELFLSGAEYVMFDDGTLYRKPVYAADISIEHEHADVAYIDMKTGIPYREMRYIKSIRIERGK